MDSVQSVVPIDIRTSGQLLRDLASAPNILVEDPHIATAGAGEKIASASRQRALCTLENAGTQAAYWKIGGIPTVGSFHGVLKACSAVNDGTGGFIDLSRVPGDVWVAATDGATAIRVVAMVGRSPEGMA